jgi:hypothetical protein
MYATNLESIFSDLSSAIEWIKSLGTYTIHDAMINSDGCPWDLLNLIDMTSDGEGKAAAIRVIGHVYYVSGMSAAELSARF